MPVLFTWASRGKATAYVYDLNSATAARDGLEHTLRLLLRSNAEKVNVLAHSMGNWVTVEAFRQIRISGDLPPANKIGTIVLAAPDIDIDVFKAQLRRFGKPQKPFYVVLSQDDRALFLSRTIAGGVTRVGDSTDTAELAALGATVIDLTDVKATDATNHDKFVQLASVAPELRGVLAQGIKSGHRGRRRDRKGRRRRRFDRCIAAHPARRADQDHRRPVSPPESSLKFVCVEAARLHPLSPREALCAPQSIEANQPQAELDAGFLHVAIESCQRQRARLRELDIRGVIDREKETIGKFERRIPGARVRSSVDGNVEVAEIGQRRSVASSSYDPGQCGRNSR